MLFKLEPRGQKPIKRPFYQILRKPSKLFKTLGNFIKYLFFRIIQSYIHAESSNFMAKENNVKFVSYFIFLEDSESL